MIKCVEEKTKVRGFENESVEKLTLKEEKRGLLSGSNLIEK